MTKRGKKLDLSDCPYYRYWNGGEPGFCYSDCRTEPSCITDEPEEGWPSRRATDLTPEEAEEADAFARVARDRR